MYCIFHTTEIEEGMFTLVKIFNLFKKNRVENTKDVANFTLKAAKEGRFLTTALFPGFFLSTLSLGVLRTNSFSMDLLEFILYLSFRVLSYIIAFLTPPVLRYVHNCYYKHGNQPPCDDSDNRKLEKVG